MPTYLCHGFRWHRRSIRYFVAIQDLDDAAPEWIVAPRSADAFLQSFYDLFDFLPPCAPPASPESNNHHNRHVHHQHQLSNGSRNTLNHDNEYDDERHGRRLDDGKKKMMRGRSLSRRRSKSKTRQGKAETEIVPPVPMIPPLRDRKNIMFNDWSVVKMLEEFDPANEYLVSGPWAYIADYVVRVDTSVSCVEELMAYEERMKMDKERAMSGPSDETGRKVHTVGSKKAGWFEKLRDQLQRGEDIRWYVVVCGDEERDTGRDVVEDSGRGGERGRPRDTPTPTLRSYRPAEEDHDDDGAEFEFRLPEFAQFRPAPPPERRSRSVERRPPTVPEKDYPPLPPLQNSQDIIDLAHRPKTPKSSGGIRRLFSAKGTNDKQQLRAV